MSEKPPQFESAESAERPPRYRTISREVLRISPEGGSVEQVIECNGVDHRLAVDEVFYDENGGIVYVDEHSRGIIGPCDGNHE